MYAGNVQEFEWTGRNVICDTAFIVYLQVKVRIPPLIIIDCIIPWYVLGSEEVFIVIHNIDGSMLRSKKVSMDCLCIT